MFRRPLAFAALLALLGCRAEEGSGARPAPTASAAASASAAAVGINPRIVRAEAFMFNGGKGEFCPLILRGDGSLCPSVEPAGKPLTRAQIEQAITTFVEPEPNPSFAAWCFEPHHGVVFYDAAGAPVTAITVCFECDRHAGWPQPGKELHEIRSPYMSPRARAAYERLFCAELGLTRCR